MLAANDNAADIEAKRPGSFDPLLVEALRHFARHGLEAARVAHGEAERETREGNAAGAAHWVAITGMFDRRLAAAASRAPIPA